MIEDFRHDFFPNTERYTLTLEIPSDEWEALQQIIAENEWERDEGLRYILAAGRAYLRMEAVTEHLEHPDVDREHELQKWQREYINMGAQLAVMKYRTFHFMEAVRVLEMKLNAYEVEISLLRQANEKLRQKLSG